MKSITFGILALILSSQALAWHPVGPTIDRGADKNLRWAQPMVAAPGDRDVSSAARVFLNTPQGKLYANNRVNAQGAVEGRIILLNPTLFPKVRRNGDKLDTSAPGALRVIPGKTYLVLVSGPEGLTRHRAVAAKPKQKPKPAWKPQVIPGNIIP